MNRADYVEGNGANAGAHPKNMAAQQGVSVSAATPSTRYTRSKSTASTLLPGLRSTSWTASLHLLRSRAYVLGWNHPSPEGRFQLGTGATGRRMPQLQPQVKGTSG